MPGNKEPPVAEYQRLSEEYARMLREAHRWGTAMLTLGEGLTARPHRVHVMMPDRHVLNTTPDIVLPTSDLPTLPQVHQLTEKIRRTSVRLEELKTMLGTLET